MSQYAHGLSPERTTGLKQGCIRDVGAVSVAQISMSAQNSHGLGLFCGNLIHAGAFAWQKVHA